MFTTYIQLWKTAKFQQSLIVLFWVYTLQLDLTWKVLSASIFVVASQISTRVFPATINTGQADMSHIDQE